MVRNSHLQPHRLAHFPTRSRLALVAGAAPACTLFVGPISAAAQAKPSPQTPQREQLTIVPAEAMKPWTGDLDGMIERGSMRVLTVYSKTVYFVDKGMQRGGTYDVFRVFEEDLNKRLAKEKKLKQKHLKVQVVFIPVARGDLEGGGGPSNAALLKLYDDGTYAKTDASWFSQSQERMRRRTDAIPTGGKV